MSKQRFMLTLDPDVYLEAQVKLGQGRISPTVNELLRQFLNANGKTRDEMLIEQEFERTKQSIEELQERLTYLSAELVKARETAKAAAKQEEDTKQNVHQALRHNNQAREL